MNAASEGGTGEIWTPHPPEGQWDQRRFFLRIFPVGLLGRADRNSTTTGTL